MAERGGATASSTRQQEGPATAAAATTVATLGCKVRAHDADAMEEAMPPQPLQLCLLSASW
jgi:hypothetical protein